VEYPDKDKVKAFHDALEAIRADPDAFRDDPKRIVPALDDHATRVFKGMHKLEYDCLLEMDEQMKKAGFTIESGGISVRMV
jgi:hypothetical protein